MERGFIHLSAKTTFSNMATTTGGGSGGVGREHGLAICTGGTGVQEALSWITTAHSGCVWGASVRATNIGLIILLEKTVPENMC